MSAAEPVREAIAAHLEAERDEILAVATGGDAAAAARVSARARARLGTGEARERLEEAVSTHAVDDRSHGALLEHIARIAELEVLARRGLSLVALGSDRVVVADRERTTRELAVDARDASALVAGPALEALGIWAVRDRAARLESFEDATERRARIRARGPAAPDDTPEDLRARCIAFLDATEDAARELVERAHHAGSSGQPSLAARIAALAPLGLDGYVSPRGRARRASAVFDALGLGAELRDAVTTTASRRLAIAPLVVGSRSRATLLLGDVEAGVASESAYLGGVARALTQVLVSRSLPIEHADAPRASMAEAMASLFGALLADGRFLARYFDDRSGVRLRVAATAALALSARHACATIVAGAADTRTDDTAREIVARALVLDPTFVSAELARSSWRTPTETETRARAMLAALAWPAALRERYDEDFFRNPRLADFVRGAAARGGLASAEAITAELGASDDAAGERVVELAENAGG